MKKILMIMLLGMSTNVAFGMDDQAAPAVAVAKQKATEEIVTQVKNLKAEIAALEVASKIDGFDKQGDLDSKKQELAKLEQEYEMPTTFTMNQVAGIGLLITALFVPQMKRWIRELKAFATTKKNKNLTKEQQLAYLGLTVQQMNDHFGWNSLSSDQQVAILKDKKDEYKDLKGAALQQKLNDLAQEYNPRNKLDNLHGDFLTYATGFDLSDLGFEKKDGLLGGFDGLFEDVTKDLL